MNRYRAWLLWAFLFMSAWHRTPAAAEVHPSASVNRSGAEISIANPSVELVFAASDARCAAVRLVNKVSGRAIPIRSDDFSIGLEGRDPLRAKDFAFKEARDEAYSGGRRLVLAMEDTSGLRLNAVYELGNNDFFLRRRLELTSGKPIDLRQVDVWLAGVDGKCSHQGFGSPVLLDDTFWGVEFPAAENRYAEGTVKLSQFPGRTVSGRFVSKTAVVGVTETGQPARWFRRYVEAFRAPSSKTPLFVNYNTWWTLMPPTEKNSLELIELFRRKLYEPYGESIDTFTLDDGWDIDASLWEINAKAFPNGFEPLVKALDAQKARLGIWLSPSSGYNHAPWLAKHGYQANSNPWYVCSSDPNYRRDIVKRVTDLAKKYNVAFFKFDGFCATCDASGHAHLPGPYAREANVEAFIELMTAVRQAQPEVCLDPTCGIWLSPWWLQVADSLWGEVSGDYPDIVVPSPIVRDSATTTRDAVFRRRCQEHPGFPPSAIEHLGIIVITPEKWEDNAMIVAGRGARLLTLYVNPQHFRHGDRDWAFLASLLKWMRHNAELLRQTELILGDPMKREPYGYAHVSGDRGLVALRNPFIEPKAVEVKLDESIGWSRPRAPLPMIPRRYRARIVYPRQELLPRILDYGAAITLELQGYETLVLQLERVHPSVPELLGARHQELRRDRNRVEYSIFTGPGKSVLLPLREPVPNVTLDGVPARLTRGTHDFSLVPTPGPRAQCTVQRAILAPKVAKDAWEIRGQCAVEVPKDARATMHVLCDPRGTAPGRIECVATVGGKPVEVRAVRTPDKPDQAHGPHPWTWFEFPVPEGRNEVAVTLTPGSKQEFFRGEIGWWLWSEHPLQKHTLVVEYSGPLPQRRADPLPLPVNMDSEREIVTIQSPKLVRIGHRWPKDKPTVWLDEVEPDEAVQDYGKLEKNRSVWQKPMIVAGQKLARGLGAHANGRIVYELAGAGFKTFRCQVGRDEHAGDGKVVFQVWADGKKLFDSGPMTKATPPKPVEVNVSGASTLELRSLDGGDGISGDHANWAEAQLAR